MISFSLRVFVIYFALANVKTFESTSNTTLDISIPIHDANENTLLELGEKSSSPLLRLIGFALKNLRCDINGPCDNWSSWTRCSSIVEGTFGLRTRMRSCYRTQNSDGCRDAGGEKTVENHNEVCEGFCPRDYNIKNNLCLRQSQTGMKHDAAEQFCKENGGHFINIDTQERFEVASSVSNTNWIWVQGKRTKQAGPWHYSVGKDPESQSFFKWKEGQPTNSSSDLYMVFYKSAFYDTPDSTYQVICEVRQ